MADRHNLVNPMGGTEAPIWDPKTSEFIGTQPSNNAAMCID